MVGPEGFFGQQANSGEQSAIGNDGSVRKTYGKAYTKSVPECIGYHQDGQPEYKSVNKRFIPVIEVVDTYREQEVKKERKFMRFSQSQKKPIFEDVYKPLHEEATSNDGTQRTYGDP